MSNSQDTVVRALTRDGAFRVIVALTTGTVQETARAQGARDVTAQRLGELVTGSILVREAMAPGHRVQLVWQGANKGGSLVADSHPDGTNRGIVNLGGRREVAIGAGSLLQVLRTMSKGIHQGVVEVPAEGGVSAGLMAYMAESEQVACVIAASTLMDGGATGRSGGYFVQLLPEADRGLLMVMTERLASFPSLESLLGDDATTAEGLVGELLFGMPFEIVSTSSVRFGCHCSKERLLASLGTLPRGEIVSMIRDNQPLDIRCDGCAREYVVTPAELATVLPPGSDLFGGGGQAGDA